VLGEIYKTAVPTIGSSSIPLWVELLFGGLGASLIGYLGRWLNKQRSTYRAAKVAPVLKDAEDIEVLKKDVIELKVSFKKFSDWLGGTKDFLGHEKHDGFIETFPLYQIEVRDSLKTIIEKIDDRNGNGH
jgi:hypothetical protein